MEQQGILVRPCMTEKATLNAEKYHQYTFQVSLTANKNEIRSAVEKKFAVEVLSVATQIRHGKVKRRGTSIGKRPNWKKAIVTLKQGQKIDFFALE